MRSVWKFVAIGLLLGTTTSALAVETVGRNHPLRKVLLDAIRPSIENDLYVDVQFVVDTLQTDGDWVYLAGTVQNTDGSPIDFSETAYAEAEAEGMFDGPTVRALMSRDGDGWWVEAYSIGATDVVEAGWPDEFGVPCEMVNYC